MDTLERFVPYEYPLFRNGATPLSAPQRKALLRIFRVCGEGYTEETTQDTPLFLRINVRTLENLIRRGYVVEERRPGSRRYLRRWRVTTAGRLALGDV